jgi:hypothetical protein
MSEVPKAVAAGVVDLATGMLLNIKTVESHPQQVVDLLAAASKDLFEGDLVVQIENIFKKARGVTTDEHYFQEILISSTNLWHYFGRVKANPKVILVVVARGDVSIGMFLMKCRSMVENGTV